MGGIDGQSVAVAGVRLRHLAQGKQRIAQMEVRFGQTLIECQRTPTSVHGTAKITATMQCVGKVGVQASIGWCALEGCSVAAYGFLVAPETHEQRRDITEDCGLWSAGGKFFEMLHRLRRAPGGGQCGNQVRKRDQAIGLERDHPSVTFDRCSEFAAGASGIGEIAMRRREVGAKLERPLATRHGSGDITKCKAHSP